MTIEELKSAEADVKDSWKDYFVFELYDYEDDVYASTISDMTADAILDIFETQGYWAGVKRRYYWSPAMLTFVTEGR